MEQRVRRMNDAITPFTLAIPQADLEDLNRRIDQTRWPDAETVDDWTQGAPLAKVKALVDAAVLKVSPGGFPASPERQKKSPNGKIIVDLNS
jgi:Epoxide hydrolase N terminus